MSASREKKLRRELRDAEATSDTVKKVKKKKKPMTQAKRKKLQNHILSAVGILIVVALALLIFVNSGVLQKNLTAVTVGSHKLTPAEFNYFYQDTYNNIKSTYTSYGMWSSMVDTSKDIASQDYLYGEGTWAENIRSSALSSAQQLYTLYDAAVEADYTLDEDTQSQLDSVPESLETYAKSEKYSNAAEYLEEYYGKGATVESYVNYLTVQQIASGYATEKQDRFTYDDEALRDYYNENEQTYDKVTYRLFTVTTVDDDSAAAKETADAMQAEVGSTEKGFADAAYKYATEDSKESYEDERYTLRSSYSYSSISSDYADWLFDKARVGGESQVFATSSGYAVVMFVSRDDNNYDTVNVRHILVQVGTSGDDGTSTEADWEACEEAINEIKDEWEATDKTEDNFAALAEEKSEDTGSASEGGLYEGVYKGQMVEEFNDWCFDESRKTGDYDVVKTTYGYHLMYYVGTGEPYWKTLADNGKRSADYDAWYTEQSASYEGKENSFGLLFTNKELAT